MSANKALQSFSTVASPDSLRASSNTAQNPRLTVAEPIIDWITVSFPASALKRNGLTPLHRFVFELFGLSEKLVMTQFSEKTWNWCPYSASIFDENNNSCGKVGERLDGSFLISLSGHGCQYVTDWANVKLAIDDHGGHISRVDIAVDDLEGQAFSVDTFKKSWLDGDFTMNGRPPQARFIDDMGSGKGCTLYIGMKGHKELCIYEKGKQLGDSNSKHTRCELRLFANKLELSSEILVNPSPFFAAAYPLLEQFVAGEIARLEVKQRCIDASVEGMVNFLKTQGGKALNLVFQSLGDEAALFMVNKICREGRPTRFKHITGDLNQHFLTSIKKVN